MNIKQSKQLKFNLNGFYPLIYHWEAPISFIYLFFIDGFPHLRLYKITEFIEKLKTIYKEGMNFDMIELSMDNENNLAYINEPFDYSIKEITPEIDELIESQATVELCRRNFMGYAVMTQENLFHLLLTWEKIVTQRSPFMLIYLDDQDWYDSLSFDSQEVMEKFVADHTKPEVTIQ